MSALVIARIAMPIARHLRERVSAIGTFTYDRTLVAFNFRYELREVTDDGDSSPAERLATVEERAMDLALAALGAEGLGAKHLRVRAWDMADAWRPTSSR